VDGDVILENVTCGANQCPYCVLTNAWHWSLAIAHVRPSRYAVFTLVPGEWHRLRLDISRLFQILDRKGYVLHAVYSAEQNPRETGYHLNVWWWGPDVPHEVLVAAAESVGWGSRVSVNRFSVDKGGAGYGLKEAVGYGMKEAARDEGIASEQVELTVGQREFLARNGGALMHARKNFWRDGVGGRPLSGRRETLRVQRERADGRPDSSTEDRQWVLVRGSEVVAHSSTTRPALVIPSVPTGPAITAPCGRPRSPSAIAGSRQAALPGLELVPATTTTRWSSPSLARTAGRSSP
jgi:hypothetical protein